jgi:DNA-binding NarL/FixJ family response regulator
VAMTASRCRSACGPTSGRATRTAGAQGCRRITARAAIARSRKPPRQSSLVWRELVNLGSSAYTDANAATRTPARSLRSSMTIRVLIADDQTLVRSGFRMILRAEPDIDVVGEAGDGAEAMALARELDPDVVLMDVRMPNVDGIEATRQIIDVGEHAPRVLVLTTFDLDQYVYEALRAGASGFLLKDAPEDQLVSGIRIVAAGASLFAPTVTRRLIERFANAAPTAPPPALGDLTPRELEVLRLVARGLSNAEIAAELVLSEHTAKTHVAHILDKLDLRDRVQAVVLAYESGMVRARR